MQTWLLCRQAEKHTVSCERKRAFGDLSVKQGRQNYVNQDTWTEQDNLCPVLLATIAPADLLSLSLVFLRSIFWTICFASFPVDNPGWQSWLRSICWNQAKMLLGDPFEECGGTSPPNLDCLKAIPLPTLLSQYSLVFICFSIFVILINALLVVYVLSKTPRRRKKQRSGNWNKYAAKKKPVIAMEIPSSTGDPSRLSTPVTSAPVSSRRTRSQA